MLESDDITGSTATADPGYKFVGWYKADAEGNVPEGAEAIGTSATLGAKEAVANLNKAGDVCAHTTYVARFAADETQTYTVTYKPESNGQVSPTSQSDQVLESDDITGSTATADPGKFVGWYKADANVPEGAEAIGTSATLGAKEAVANLNKAGDVYAHTTYVARFAADETQTYTVTYKPESNGQVSPTSQSDQVLESDDITGSTATADPGYKFVGWYKADAEGNVPEGAEAIGTSATLGAKEAVANLNKAGDVARFAHTQTYDLQARGQVSPTSQSTPTKPRPTR